MLDLPALISPIQELCFNIKGEHFNEKDLRFSELHSKDLNQLVTNKDIQVEKELVSGLKRLLPNASFLTEEKTVKESRADYQWIIDPIDGTTNFIHGIPAYCISIGLLYNDEIILGIVFELNREEFFHAIKDKGAFLNGVSIHTSKADTLADTLIATGFPYYDFERTNRYLKVLEQFMKNTRGVRRLGSAALDLAYVACGRFDAFFEYSLSPWDVAGGALLVKEAGGIVCDFKGGDAYLYGREIIASQTNISEDVLQIVRSQFHE